MLRGEIKKTVALATAVILAVLLETIDPGASIGLCLAYTACLLITPKKQRPNKLPLEVVTLGEEITNRGLLKHVQKIKDFFRDALFLTMPISMLHQRNLVATFALSLGLALWLFRDKMIYNTIVKSNPQNRISKILKEFKGYPYRYIALTALLFFTLWTFIVQGFYNLTDMRTPMNLMATFTVTLVWCILCMKVNAPWRMVIPILMGAWLSLLMLYITNTIDPIVARGLTSGEDRLLIGPFSLTPMLGHKNNIATLATITLSILCFCLCKSQNQKINNIKNKQIENDFQFIDNMHPTRRSMGLAIAFWANCLLIILTPSRLGQFSAIILISLLLLNWTWVSDKGKIKKLWISMTIVLLGILTINSTELIRSHIFYKTSEDPSKAYDISTGRLKIWEIALSIQKNKILGMGTDHWEKEGTQKMVAYNNFPAESTHNGFIEVFLAYGLAGLGLLITSMLCTTIHALKWCSISREYIAREGTSHTKGTLKGNYPITSVLIPSSILLLGTTLPMLTESYSWAWLGSPIISIWMGFCLSLNTHQNPKDNPINRRETYA